MVGLLLLNCKTVWPRQIEGNDFEFKRPRCFLMAA